jgi:hypothetical protein
LGWRHWCTCRRSSKTRNEAAIQCLWEEIGRIKEQQAAAEKMAALVCMTTDESMQYKEGMVELKS